MASRGSFESRLAGKKPGCTFRKSPPAPPDPPHVFASSRDLLLASAACSTTPAGVPASWEPRCDSRELPQWPLSGGKYSPILLQIRNLGGEWAQAAGFLVTSAGPSAKISAVAPDRPRTPPGDFGHLSQSFSATADVGNVVSAVPQDDSAET